MNNDINRQVKYYKNRIEIPKTDSSQVNRSLTYIHNHLFSSSLSVKKILEHCYIRRNSFSPLFKLHTGVTPKKYIIKQRIMAAKKIGCSISRENYSIGLIAFAVGFGTQSAFTKAFKKEEGILPSRYFKK